MPGIPADKSLFSKIVQGSKSLSPRRVSLRISGSMLMTSPLGTLKLVGSLISGLSEPKRTFSPAW